MFGTNGVISSVKFSVDELLKAELLPAVVTPSEIDEEVGGAWYGFKWIAIVGAIWY
jgi:hypothetical protein